MHLEQLSGVIEPRGLFRPLYNDRGSHYWHTPEVGGKVDENNLTRLGRALAHLGVDQHHKKPVSVAI